MKLLIHNFMPYLCLNLLKTIKINNISTKENPYFKGFLIILKQFQSI